MNLKKQKRSKKKWQQKFSLKTLLIQVANGALENRCGTIQGQEYKRIKVWDYNPQLVEEIDGYPNHEYWKAKFSFK